MTDPFGLMKFAECEHQQLKCEKCGARSDIRGWQTFTGKDKDMLELRDEIDRLTARLAAAQTRNECPICGLTPGAISTCFCEECVGELRQRLAAAEAALADQKEINKGAVRAAMDNANKLAAAEALWETAVQFEGPDWADHIAQSLKAEKARLQ